MAVGATAYASSLAYPRYDIAAHETFRGLQGYDPRDELNPFGAVPDSELKDWTARAYVAEDGSADATADYLVAVATGDFHEMRASYVYDGGIAPMDTDGIGTVHDDWRAGDGPYGGWMRCLNYTGASSGTPRAMCVWGDKGSMGAVLFTTGDKTHDAVEETARSIGADFLRPAGD